MGGTAEFLKTGLQIYWRLLNTRIHIIFTGLNQDKP